MKELDLKLMKYWKKEEREQILDKINKYLTWMQASDSYTTYARKKVEDIRNIIEFEREV